MCFSSVFAWACREQSIGAQGKGRAAFSLVEVAIAIGIVSFALLALVGLMSTGLQGSRESDEDTKLALCVESVQGSLQLEGFGKVATNASYVAGNSQPSFLFDSSGSLQVDASGNLLKTANADSRYGAVVKRLAPTPQAGSHLVMLQVKFVWPLSASASNRQQRVVVMGLANRE